MSTRTSRRRASTLILIAAIGSFLVLARGEIADAQTWEEALSPHRIAELLGHLGTVLAGYVAGQIGPTTRLTRKMMGQHPAPEFVARKEDP